MKIREKTAVSYGGGTEARRPVEPILPLPKAGSACQFAHHCP